MKELPKLNSGLIDTRDLLQLEEQLAAEQNHPNYPGYYDGYTDEKMRLREYFQTVRNHIWLILGITITGTLLMAIYMARQPDIFESRARVQVDLENLGSKSGASDKGMLVVSNPVNDPTYFNTQLQILKGEALQRRVVKTLDLNNNPKFFQSGENNQSTVDRLQKMIGLKAKDDGENEAAQTTVPVTAGSKEEIAPASSNLDLAEAEQMAPFVGRIRSGLSIEPVRESSLPNKETRLIDIKYTSSDPKAATKIVNVMADTFVLSNMERRVETNTSAGNFLSKRVAELQIQIRSGEERLLNYAANNEILSLDPSQNTVVDRLVGLNKQLLEAENERKQTEAAYRAASAPNAAEALTENDRVTGESVSKIADLKRRRAELLVDYTEKYPEVKQIDEQIAALENQVRQTRERASNILKTNLETKYKEAAARENAVREAFNKQKGETLTQNSAAVNYRIIQQEIETNKNLLNSLMQQARENDVIKAGNGNNISVVEYAVTPKSPIAPKRLSMVTLAFLLSLFSGVGLALFLDYLNASIKNSEDVEKYLHLPTLAAIPLIGNSVTRKFFSSRSQALLDTDKPELLINQDTRSPLSEAYRQLRTSILLSVAGHPPKTILITSTMPAEGKTTTSINIACSLAQTGNRVLIIDADMRRPQIHKNFGISNKNGLSTLLSANVEEVEIDSLIQEDKVSGVSVLASGLIPPNPAELLGSQQMRKILEVLESKFNYIIIDSPPVATCTDAFLIANMVEGTVLVIKAGETNSEIVRRSRQKLGEIKARIIGVVLNKVTKGSNEYYYSYYKNYYSNTEDEDSETKRLNSAKVLG
jgi:succinoglycan biosynthesis transport protein ExoP